MRIGLRSVLGWVGMITRDGRARGRGEVISVVAQSRLEETAAIGEHQPSDPTINLSPPGTGARDQLRRQVSQIPSAGECGLRMAGTAAPPPPTSESSQPGNHQRNSRKQNGNDRRDRHDQSAELGDRSSFRWEIWVKDSSDRVEVQVTSPLPSSPMSGGLECRVPSGETPVPDS